VKEEQKKGRRFGR